MPNTQALTEDQWFYEDKGERKGGIDTQQIIALIQSGKLIYGSPVWKSGMSDWIAIEKTELRQHLGALSAPPLTGTHVNNSLAWLLAFAPFIGFLLESFVAGLMGNTGARWEHAMADSRYWYVTLILNIALSLLDEKRLKQAGHDTSRFKFWVFILPVYLYTRAKMLNQSRAYFIVWIICFVITWATAQSLA